MSLLMIVGDIRCVVQAIAGRLGDQGSIFLVGNSLGMAAKYFERLRRLSIPLMRALIPRQVQT